MRQLRIDHLWLTLPIAALIWAGFRKPLCLFDFWWQLKTGEVMVHTGTLVRCDLFSFTAAGSPAFPHAWLAQLLFYLVYDTGGLALLVLLNTALLVAALLPVYHLCWRGTGGNIPLSVLAAMLAVVGLAVFGNLRPQVFSFALFTAFLWVLFSHKRRHHNLLWTLPVLMPLWVNLHGAFVLGLGLIAVFLAGETSRSFFLGPGPNTFSTRELTGLAAILVLSSAATLLNPDTYEIYAFLRSMANPDVQVHVREWQPPRIDHWEGVLLFYGPFFLTLLGLLSSDHRLDFTELLLFLGFAAFGMKSNRYGSWFYLVATPLLARCLASLRPAATLECRAERDKEGPKGRNRWALNMLVAGLMLAVTVLLSPWVYPFLRNQQPNQALVANATPVKAMDFIQQRQLQGNIFHPQLYGDYLIWRLWPEHRTFIDGRVHQFPESFVREYQHLRDDPSWEKHLAPYDIQLLLLGKTESDWQKMITDARHSPRWRLRYEDEITVVFQRVR